MKLYTISSLCWGGPSAFGIYMFSLHWYFLISSYYLTVSNGHSLTALKSIEVTQSSGSFSGEGSSAFGIYMFSLQWYFLISSYYLTVSNGCSLTALKSIEVTQSCDSFKWGRGGRGEGEGEGGSSMDTHTN